MTKTTTKPITRKHLLKFWMVHKRLKLAEEALWNAGWQVQQIALLRNGLHTPFRGPRDDENMPTMFAAAEAADCPVVELLVRHKDSADSGRALLVVALAAARTCQSVATVPDVNLASYGLAAVSVLTPTAGALS